MLKHECDDKTYSFSGCSLQKISMAWLAPHQKMSRSFKLTDHDVHRYTAMTCRITAQTFLRSRYLMDLVSLHPTPMDNGYLYCSDPMSLTHKDGWIVCAYHQQPSLSVGVDLETTQLTNKLAAWLLTRYAPQLDFHPLVIPTAASAVFSAREALYKALSRNNHQKLIHHWTPTNLECTKTDQMVLKGRIHHHSITVHQQLMTLTHRPYVLSVTCLDMNMIKA